MELNSIVKDGRSRGVFRLENFIYYILGVLNVLLIIRLLFKLLGANPVNKLVGLLYSFTGFFIKPFSNIFNNFTFNSGEANIIFEPSVLIAIIVYSAAAIAITRLIEILFFKK